MSPERQAATDAVEDAVEVLLAVVLEEEGADPAVLTAWCVSLARTSYPRDGGPAESLVSTHSQETLPEWQQAGLLGTAHDLVREFLTT